MYTFAFSCYDDKLIRVIDNQCELTYNDQNVDVSISIKLGEDGIICQLDEYFKFNPSSGLNDRMRSFDYSDPDNEMSILNHIKYKDNELYTYEIDSGIFSNIIIIKCEKNMIELSNLILETLKTMTYKNVYLLNQLLDVHRYNFNNYSEKCQYDFSEHKDLNKFFEELGKIQGVHKEIMSYYVDES